MAQSLGTRRTLHTFKLGLVTGFVYFGGTVYWVQTVMATFGGLSWWVGTLVAMLLAAYLALYPALFALLVGRSVRRFGVTGVWLAPWCWVATEWLRATVGGGFPWVLLGTSQARVLPVVQFASLAGVYGLSWLIALVGAAAAAIAISRRGAHVRAAIGVAALLGLIATWGVFRVAGGGLAKTGAVLRVGIVQGNVAQDQKWDPAFKATILHRHLDLSRQVLGAGAGLVLWPEASTPFFLDVDVEMAALIRKLAVQSRVPFLIGTDTIGLSVDGKPAPIYNAAVLVGADGRSQASYRKMVLVPFGEYVPLKKMLFFVGPLVEAVSSFSPGVEPVVFDIDGRHVSVAICYESVSPWIARAFTARGSELLATITNDAWFGQSSAAYQHFDQGMLRAVEEGRFVVRAANTGISGAVDPYGRVVVQTKMFVPAAVTVDVRLLHGRTLYSLAGDVVVWLSLAVVAGVLLTGRRSRMITA